MALGGTAAVVAGGAALAMTPQIRGLFGDDAAAGDATGSTVTDGTAARPSGQQPSTVRTYTEQNESYMGSRAGDELKQEHPGRRADLLRAGRRRGGDQGDRQDGAGQGPDPAPGQPGHLRRRRPQVIADIKRDGHRRLVCAGSSTRTRSRRPGPS